MNKNKKYLLIAGIAGGSLFFSLSAQASFFPNDNLFSSLLEQLNQQISQIGTVFEDSVSSIEDTFDQILNLDLEQIADVGTLGIPDLGSMRKKIEEQISENPAPIYQGGKLPREVERQIIRTKAQSVFNKEGQEQTRQKLQTIQQSTGQVQALANEAQAEIITQEVMKDIAQQNAINSSLISTFVLGQEEAAIKQEMANLELTNISETLDGQSQAKQIETVGAGFSVMRTTSYAGLF